MNAIRKILTLVLVLYSVQTLAQEKFSDSKRSLYIFDIAKSVKWPVKDSLTHFHIIILAHDSLLYNHLKIKSDSLKTIKELPLRVSLCSSLDSLKAAQLVYVHKQSNFDIERVLLRVRGKGTLLISENFEFHKSMINFIIFNNQRRFEINEKRLLDEGFTISRLFKALAVQKKADWQKIYESTEHQLEDEKEKVAQQNKEIELQKSLIRIQKDSILIQRKEIEKQLDSLDLLLKTISEKQIELRHRNMELIKQRFEINSQKDSIDLQVNILGAQKVEIDKQKENIEKQREVLNDQLEKIKVQQLILYLFVVFIVLLIVIAILAYKAYKIKRQANLQLEQKNKAISDKNQEIEQQRDLLAKQKQEITDSIVYARRIQQAVLPPEELCQNILPEHFILNRPRDIVSGDYYWLTKLGGKIILVAADCTGHGVPGAFMSMLGVSLLNDIVKKNKIVRADQILNELRLNVMRSLHQTGSAEEAKDGMDMSLCIIDENNKLLEFAGAYNPLFIIQDGELDEIKADKMPVSIHLKANTNFTRHVIPYKSGDCIYMFSDGYVDQFGGPDDKKFMKKRFKNLLLEITHQTMIVQKHILVERLDNWQGNTPQIDDVLVVGVRLP